MPDFITNFIKSDLTKIILVAALAVLGNIVYFEYRFYRGLKKEVIRERLIKLLLPLYYKLKIDELEMDWAIEQTDPYEHEADRPVRLLRSLSKIIQEHIYLADDELHVASIKFLEWAYRGDPEVRFQLSHEGELKDEEFERFKELVYRKYNEARKEYFN